MTKTFSSLIAALAISASLVAVTTPVSAFTATGDVSRVSSAPLGLDRNPATDLSSNRIANGDLGSGRGGDGVISGPPISGTDLGSGRIEEAPNNANGPSR